MVWGLQGAPVVWCGLGDGVFVVGRGPPLSICVVACGALTKVVSCLFASAVEALYPEQVYG